MFQSSPSACAPPQFIKGDLQSADLLSYVLDTEQIDTVMHFAAQTHVDNSFGNSLAFTMNNTCVGAPTGLLWSALCP
jgi:dTDP-D-glucose 4,6-dehydratase